MRAVRLIWLGGGDGTFALMDHPRSPARVSERPTSTTHGRLDLLGPRFQRPTGQAINLGTKNYHWQVIRTRAVTTTGDQRINSLASEVKCKFAPACSSRRRQSPAPKSTSARRAA